MKFFISYSRKNEKEIVEIAKDIKDLGHHVWFDSDLYGGEDWWREILKQIRDCNVFIFALSKESQTSKACELELQYANDLNKMILPIVVVNNYSSRLASKKIQSKQYLDYSSVNQKDSYKSLVTTLDLLIASPPIPKGVPEPLFPIDQIVELRELLLSPEDLTPKVHANICFKLKNIIKQKEANKSEINELVNLIKGRNDLTNESRLLVNEFEKVDEWITSQKILYALCIFVPVVGMIMGFKGLNTKANKMLGLIIMLANLIVTALVIMNT